MKRIMLMAGPWMMNGKDSASRIVCYQGKTNELVVHTQNYAPGDTFGKEVNFTGGQYFKLNRMQDALETWTARNNDNVGNAIVAPFKLADAANAADLSSQYYREPMGDNDKPPQTLGQIMDELEREEQEELKNREQPQTMGELVEALKARGVKPVTMKELADQTGIPEAKLRRNIELLPNAAPIKRPEGE